MQRSLSQKSWLEKIPGGIHSIGLLRYNNVSCSHQILPVLDFKANWDISVKKVHKMSMQKLGSRSSHTRLTCRYHFFLLIWREQTWGSSHVPACCAIPNDIMHRHEKTPHLWVFPNSSAQACHQQRLHQHDSEPVLAIILLIRHLICQIPVILMHYQIKNKALSAQHK